MLETLRHIVQEVNAARGLEEALDIIVRRVQDAMQTQVCSVYLQDGNSDRLSFRCCIVIGMLLTVLASFKKVARIAEIGLGLNVMTINQGDK